MNAKREELVRLRERAKELQKKFDRDSHEWDGLDRVLEFIKSLEVDNDLTFNDCVIGMIRNTQRHIES